MDSVILTDGPMETILIGLSKLLVQTNVNPDKDFLVTIKDLYQIQWKIFSAP